ncbi:anaphase-promoting complex subunit 10 [Nematocida homosporus]|uniref:anaphase-promoting complex subunit 10 n=1 Tax=Nematocida homosporus TaxID=1912981 RepID=UPI002220F02F|nr:anaphase-promoting complex subunit 10 [Nematocida homosporus]KAI5185007.1 anaphase-promoting complex subunit 10 [Nematocida homosporus]
MEARVSTYKPDHGPEELFSDDLEKYWHTDGNLPHHIEIEFEEIKHLLEIRLTLGHAQDKSYIPKEIDIRCGKTKDSIVSVKKALISDKLSIANITVNQDCCILQMVILSNHQEGRDSRIRGLSLFFAE